MDAYCTSCKANSPLRHVHGHPVDAVTWAKGVLAMEYLAGNSMAVHLAGLPKAARKAKKILRQSGVR
jgi:hypothetical protein